MDTLKWRHEANGYSSPMASVDTRLYAVHSTKSFLTRLLSLFAWKPSNIENPLSHLRAFAIQKYCFSFQVSPFWRHRWTVLVLHYTEDLELQFNTPRELRDQAEGNAALYFYLVPVLLEVGPFWRTELMHQSIFWLAWEFLLFTPSLSNLFQRSQNWLSRYNLVPLHAIKIS